MKKNPVRHTTKFGIWSGVLCLAVLQPAGADELADLKAAVADLQARIAQLEAQAKAAGETNDRQTDQIAMVRSNTGSWVQNFTFKGDFRYRNETIDQQYSAQRNRDRIRVRAGFVAKINDSLKTEFALATSEGNDPRSSNQTLGGENSRKNLFLDLAYVEWQAAPALKLTAGKMKYPWIRPGSSALFDGDVNPEGLAAAWSQGDFFASATYNILEERSSAGESTLTAGQIGWRPSLGEGRLTLAGGYFDFNSVQHRAAYFGGNANGNTTTSVGCFGGAASCLAYDYNLVEALAEYSRPVGGRPLAVFADFARNGAADNGLDTAWSAGINWGRASEPRSWEIGYYYQSVEKDALFGQFIDSDVGAGNTDHRAHVLRMGYALAKNWLLNVAYQRAETSFDVPASISGIGAVRKRDYERLQLDLNFKY